MKVLLATSQGGHLTQLLALQPWWTKHDRIWVSTPTEDARFKLAEERVIWAAHPTTRNLPNLMRNLRLAWTTFRQYDPDVVVSTGAGVAVPFFWLGRLLGTRTVFIEVYDRVDSRTVTGLLCYPFCDLFLTQWEEQRQLWPRAVLLGRLL